MVEFFNQGRDVKRLFGRFSRIWVESKRQNLMMFFVRVNV